MKIITLHYKPIEYAILIVISSILFLFLLHNLIGTITSEETENSGTRMECKNWLNSKLEETTDCKVVKFTETNRCAWNLLDNIKECGQTNYDRSKWEAGLVALIAMNTFWYLILFFFLNDSKHWVKVKWVE